MKFFVVEKFMDWLMTQPWPWWLSGILIGLTVPVLWLLTGKWFGVSTSLQQLSCTITPNSNLEYFRSHDRQAHAWTLLFVLGMAAGGWIASQWLASEPVQFLPSNFRSWPGAVLLLVGGALVGFGARYAGGCTSGHAITGIANLNWPSLVATVCFFIGGLAVTWGLGGFLFGTFLGLE